MYRICATKHDNGSVLDTSTEQGWVGTGMYQLPSTGQQGHHSHMMQSPPRQDQLPSLEKESEKCGYPSVFVSGGEDLNSGGQD